MEQCTGENACPDLYMQVDKSRVNFCYFYCKHLNREVTTVFTGGQNNQLRQCDQFKRTKQCPIDPSKK